MNIVIISDAYPPEIRSSSHLMQELAIELKSRGHEVTVATCYPQYNLSESASLKEYEELTIEDGIRIIRIRTLPHKKVGYVVRGISQALLPYIFWNSLKRHLDDRVDCVLVYSPPLPLWKVGHFIKKKYGAMFILNLQDIFPQNAIDLGILRNPALIRYYEYVEHNAYKAADVITVHSEGNRQFLLDNKKINRGKLHVLHNWIDIDEDSNHEKENRQSFRARLGLENKFIFFFGGVLGPSQGLDLVVNAAAKLKDVRDAVILFVGDGVEKDNLMKLVSDLGLTNIIFHPFISKEDYRILVDEIDVGLVCLSDKNRTPVVPGKILSYMAARKPVCAFLNRESDGHQIIMDARCGERSVSNDIQKAYELMLRMYEDKDRLSELGNSGYSYALKCFSQKVCVDKLEGLIRK